MESGIGIFFLWNLDSWALESGNKLNEPAEVPLTIVIRNPISGILYLES